MKCLKQLLIVIICLSIVIVPIDYGHAVEKGTLLDNDYLTLYDDGQLVWKIDNVNECHIAISDYKSTQTRYFTEDNVNNININDIIDAFIEDGLIEFRYDYSVYIGAWDVNQKPLIEGEATYYYQPAPDLNPVKSIQFMPASLTVTEHTSGSWDKISGEDVYIYDIYSLINNNGNQIIINSNDVYTYGDYLLSGDSYTGFYNENGDRISVRITDTQTEEPWQAGDTHTVVLEYMGKTCEVEITVVVENILNDYVYFGLYPQTEIVSKPEDSGVYGKNWSLDSDYEVDEELYDKLVFANYDDNGDTVIKGVKYRRASTVFSDSGGDCYHDDSAFHFFRFEPIKWYILRYEGDELFLLSSICLDYHEYGESGSNWESSSIRSWLNDGFYNTAFNSCEKKLINNNQLVSLGSADTIDHVFLLSYKDVLNTEYGFNNDANYHDALRQAKSSTFAKAMGVRSDSRTSTTYIKYLGNASNDWSLRDVSSDNIYSVSEFGNVWAAYPTGTSNASAVRPAINISVYDDIIDSKNHRVLSGHVWNDNFTVDVEPTCTEEGFKSIHCAVCGTIKDGSEETVAVSNHRLTRIDAKEPTLEKDGNVEYWVCEVCDKCFSDAEGENEITAESVIVPFDAAIVASGECGAEGSNIEWSLDERGVLTISGEGQMASFESASSIPWYSERNKILGIAVSDGVTGIGDRAFYQCSNLIEVEIASSVKSIGSWAFYGASALKEVIIPEAVESLGNSSFRSCNSLKKVVLEGNAPILGTYVFTDTSTALIVHHYENTTGFDEDDWSGLNVVADHKLGIKKIRKVPTCTDVGYSQCICEICGETITEEIPALGHDYVDGYCTRCGEREVLSSGKCGENVNYILYGDGELIISGSGSMYNWPRNTSVPWYGYSERIETITIENGITSIGDGAFWDCSLLTDITIPNSVTNIGNSAFRSCSNLVKVTIPESVINIGRLAFCECSSLTNINIPEGISSIEYQAFYKCNSLTNITIPNGVINICEGAFSGCSSLTNITIPEGVTSIGGGAFWNCSSLTKIIIPESVKSIEPTAFSGCSNLTAITIPEGVTIIGDGTFENCSSLTGITIPESVTSIGENAFSGCSSLTSIAIPDSVTGIGKGAFWNCSSLASITLPFIGGNSTGDNHFGYIFGASSHLGNDSYVPSSLKEVVITGDITSIETDAFYKCSSIKSIIIPNGVTSIEINAFSECSSLENITIPEGVVSIGDGAFFACYNLKSIEIPDSVAEIGVAAFSNCTSLERIVIPGKVKMINTETLYNCTNLKEIIILGDTTGISGKAAFDGCSSLSNIFVIKGSPADSWILHNGYQEKLKYIYESGDHYFYDTLVEATCTVPGQKNSLCVICGEKITEDIPALGHDWGEWTVEKEATTTEEGLEVRTCKRDPSHTETRAIPKKEPVVDGVTRIAGKSRYLTSLMSANAYKEQLGLDKFDNVIVACGTNYADALAGSYLSIVKKAPILLVRNRTAEIDLVQDYIKENLNENGTIYILGGTAVVPDTIKDALEGYNGFEVKRLYGKDRYATNVEILKEAGISGDEIIVASGIGFADSLSASALGKPVLLVKGTVQPSQEEYIKSLAGKHFCLIGGKGAVSEDMNTYLKGIGTTERISGKNRYETSAKVAERFFAAPDGAVLAYGEDYPDGLCGGSLANAIGGPLLLSRNGRTNYAADFAESTGIKSGFVLGGKTLISDDDARTIFQMSADGEILVK